MWLAEKSLVQHLSGRESPAGDSRDGIGDVLGFGRVQIA